MVHFLRNNINRTVIECQVTKTDLSSAVDIFHYSNELLGSENQDKLIADIANLNEIRGTWWEREKDFGDWKTIDEFVASEFKKVAKRHRLAYVTG